MADYTRYMQTTERVTQPKPHEYFTKDDILEVLVRNDGNMFRAQHELRKMSWEDYRKEKRYLTYFPALALTAFSGYNVLRLGQLTTGGKVLAVGGFALSSLYTINNLKFKANFGRSQPQAIDTSEGPHEAQGHKVQTADTVAPGEDQIEQSDKQ